MPNDRFFHDGPLEGRVIFRDQELQHLRVSRLQLGENFEVIDGRGGLAQATLTRLDRREAEAELSPCTQSEPPAERLILIQALPRLNRLDTIAEKCTELGMTDFWLFPGERSEKKELTKQQQTRVEHLCIAATKQCGRLFLPRVNILPPISKWKDLPEGSYFGDVRPSAPLLARRMEATESLAFIVGPESGLSERELERIEQLGAAGVSLHENILRTDTAPILALGLLAHLRKDRIYTR
ncbi:MAG: 16S rRNA (uracil(1498)-N(3))-methyltransferase [Chlamydiia bacterium]|nr:16S rRNA (uracil(1498)-N(3))-methyltransferase [Chlamydiia bacterium]